MDDFIGEENIKRFFDTPIPYHRDLLDDEYSCPITTEIVEKEFCESFCMGEGCKYLKTCDAYIKNNIVLTKGD